MHACQVGAAAERLWDQEPSLWELAQQATLKQDVPRSDPQSATRWGGGTAVGMSTTKLKLSLWGPPEQMTLSLGKTDVWDRRCFQEPTLTIARIRQTIQEGKTPPKKYYASWNAYDAPCPKPVGQVILGCRDFAQADAPAAVTSLYNGVRRVETRREGSKAVLQYLPMMTKNVIAIQCGYEGVRHSPWVRLHRHQDTIPYGKSMQGYGGPDPRPYQDYDYSKDKNNGPIEAPTSETDGTCFWIRQRFPAEKTFPQGFEYVLAARIVGCPATIEAVNGRVGLGTPPDHNAAQKKQIEGKQGFWHELPFYEAIRNAPGAAATATLAGRDSVRFVLLAAVVTTAEASDPLAAAKHLLSQAADQTFADLAAANAEWYRTLYQRREKGRVFRGNVEDSKGQLAEIATSWRCPHSGECLPNPARYEADAAYAYMGQDWAPWHGLPCYNELYYTSTHVQNRSDRLSMWYHLVDFWMPACRKNAQEVFALPGALIQHGYLPPVKADTYHHTTAVWEFCMEIPAQVLKVLWDAYDYGGDEKFLAESAYPAMRELAIFYSRYATLGEDGHYHVIPTVSAEHWGWTKNFAKNRDTTSALCMFRWLLNTAATASEILHRDADLRGRWREVAAKLAPYPTWETPEGTVFTDARGVNPMGTDYNWFAGVTPTLLADEINLDSPETQRGMMLRTARLVKGWAVNQVPLLLGAERGYAPEQLINSRSGRIHLFPAIPSGATVAFREMQARGGFEVSAECVKGSVTFVQLHARRDGACRLMNPWPSHEVAVVQIGPKQAVSHQVDSSNGECLCFPVQQGKSYHITALRSKP
jgi:hypothetical protein